MKPSARDTPPRSKHSLEARKAMQKALKESLHAYIGEWIKANCDDNPYWSEAWFAGETQDRMVEAAWLVFMSSRDGQRFAEEQR